MRTLYSQNYHAIVLDGLGFVPHISSMQDISASLCFRGQRIFLHNASGWFGDVPLEASGDFGIHPDEGEFHLMCQVCYWRYLGQCTRVLKFPARTEEKRVPKFSSAI